jgi:hypothetical protein
MQVTEVIQAKKALESLNEKFLGLIKKQAERLVNRESGFDPTSKNADKIWKSLQAERRELEESAEIIDGITENFTLLLRWNEWLKNEWLKSSKENEAYQRLFDIDVMNLVREQVKFEANFGFNKKKAVLKYLKFLVHEQSIRSNKSNRIKIHPKREGT